MNTIGSYLTTTFRYLLAVGLVAAAATWTTVSAQYPDTVYVEGNCAGGTPSIPGACGDYDGDGAACAVEDADADSVFCTIQAALEAIDHNGKVVIVSSGVYNENVYIGQAFGGFAFGATNPGNVTLEGAPGVEATIDAFSATSTAGDNDARSQGAGISVNYTTTGNSRVVTIRNVEVRNFAIGIAADNNSRVNIDNVRVENNLFFGIRLSNQTRGAISNSHVTATGFRLSNAPAPATPAGQTAFVGSGIFANQNSHAFIVETVSSHNSNWGIATNNAAPNTAAATVSRVSAPFNNSGPFTGNVIQCTNTAICSAP